MTASRITLNYRQIHHKQILHILCLTKLLTTRPPAFQGTAVGALCALSLQWQKCGFFTTDQNNSGKGESKYTLQVDNCKKAQEKMPSRCVNLSSITTKRHSEKNPMFVDATPTADGNKRRLKLVAFCIAKPKLHLRSTLPVIVFK